MNRQEKQHVIDAIKNDFKSVKQSFVVYMQGMTVEADAAIASRTVMLKKEALRLLKILCLKRATNDMPGLNELAPYFKDQIAVVFAENEAPAIAKILFNTSKNASSFKA